MNKRLYQELKRLVEKEYATDTYSAVAKLLKEILAVEKPALDWDDIKVGEWFRYKNSIPQAQYLKITSEIAWYFFDGSFRDVMFKNRDIELVKIEPKITPEMEELLKQQERLKKL